MLIIILSINIIVKNCAINCNKVHTDVYYSSTYLDALYLNYTYGGNLFVYPDY